MKLWEEMSNAERTEQTCRDLRLREKRRLEKKKKAEYEANSFTIESSMRCAARVRKSKNRGCRSCR